MSEPLLSTPLDDITVDAVQSATDASDEKFLIWSYEHDMWWRPDWRGYTKNRNEAGRYTGAEADEICGTANGGVLPGQPLQEIAIAESDHSPIGPAPLLPDVDESKPILTADQLAEIRARADAATVAPWAEADGSWVIASAIPKGAARIASGAYGDASWEFYGGELICETIGGADAAFVAHARQDVPALLDHVDEISRSYQDLVERSAQEADRAQALVLRKDEELAAHDDLHRAAANRIEQLVRDLALQREATAGAREIIRLALMAMREPVTHTDARRAREILQKYHHECAVAAVKARRESAPFPTAPGASL